MKQLKTVYNRGLSDGYYLGRLLPEWSGHSGNNSTDERIFVGLINHYFNKAKVAELNIQAHEIKKGDRIVIIGKTSGVIHRNIKEIMRDEKFIEITEKSDMVTIPMKERVRHNDKVYLIKQRKNVQES